MWLDNTISNAIGWCAIQAIEHPKTALAITLISFIIYYWVIDYIGRRLSKNKVHSEPLQEIKVKKGTQVPIKNKDAAERLYGSEEENE